MNRIIGLFILVLFTSCGIINNGAFTSRKYTKGVFFEKRAKAFNAHQLGFNANDATQKLKLKPYELKLTAKTDTCFLEKEGLNRNSLKTYITPHIKSLPEKRNLIASKEKVLKGERKLKQPQFNNITKVPAKSDNGNAGEVAKFILYTLLFVIMTIIYTFSILVKMPGFPLILAIPLAMVLAFLTVITGVIFL